jgi:hypothetical protein
MSESRFSIIRSGSPAKLPLKLPFSQRAPALDTTESKLAQRAVTPAEILKWTFSFPAMLGTLLVGFVYIARRGFEVDPDFWWHLKVGEGILATHRWPVMDPYSFTAAGQPWMACEWVGDVMFASVERAAGFRGLEALLIGLSAAVLLALYVLSTQRSGNAKASFVTSALLLVLALPVLSMRPQMLGYLFLILTLIALTRFRQGHRGLLWSLPILFLFWINTHGSWVLGLGTIFVYWASGLKGTKIGGVELHEWAPKDRQRLSLVFLLSLAVLPFTPYGTRLAAYPFQVASSVPINIQSIHEWQPMPLNLPGGKFFLALILLSFAAQLVLKLTWRLEEVVLFFFGAFMAFLHVRFILAFVPFYAPLCTTVLARWVPGYERKKDLYLVNAVLTLSMLAAMVKYFPSQASIDQARDSHAPARAVEFLRLHPIEGPMLNSYGFGGYLLWARGPEKKVFIDGRGELYENAGVFADYNHITLLKPGAMAVLSHYSIQTCFLERKEPFANMLAVLPEWQEVYHDEISVLYVRRNGSGPIGVSSAHDALSSSLNSEIFPMTRLAVARIGHQE